MEADMFKMKLFKNSKIAEEAALYILALGDKQIKNLKPGEVAAAINKNPRLLTLLFRIFYNISPGKYILREKLYRAFFLIETGSTISIPELSERLGFAGVSQFEKEFENFYCITPGRYQELIQKRRSIDNVQAN